MVRDEHTDDAKTPNIDAVKAALDNSPAHSTQRQQAPASLVSSIDDVNKLLDLKEQQGGDFDLTQALQNAHIVSSDELPNPHDKRFKKSIIAQRIHQKGQETDHSL